MKINIGSYTVMFRGWINIDILPIGVFAAQNNYQYLVHDVRAGLPFPDQTVDYVYSSHMLEHVTYKEGEALLKEAYRVMKPGAVFRLSVPDMQLCAKKYLERNVSDIDAINKEAPDLPLPAQKIWHVLTSHHLAGYDWEVLCEFATRAGFRNLARKMFGESQCPVFVNETKDLFPEVSLYMEMTK